MDFLTTIVVDGNNTGIEVPHDVMSSLGTGKRFAVAVTVDGYTFRSTVSTYKGRNLIPLSAAHRTAAGVSGGDQVAVQIVLDTAPREVVIPSILAEALDASPRKKAVFAGLSFTNRNRIATSVEAAKSEATRSRRVAAALEELGD